MTKSAFILFIIVAIACEKPIVEPDITNPIEGQWWLGDSAPYYYDFHRNGKWEYLELIDADKPGLGFELQARAIWSTRLDTLYLTEIEIASGDDWVAWEDFQEPYSLTHSDTLYLDGQRHIRRIKL